MAFILNNIKLGKHKNKICEVNKISPNYFKFRKLKIKYENLCWCGFEYKPRKDIIYVSFEIKFLSDVPKPDSGFYFKTHNKVNYYDSWLNLCKKNQFVKINLELNIINKKQLFIFISDYYIQDLNFELKNLNFSENKINNICKLKERRNNSLNVVVKGFLFKPNHIPFSKVCKKLRYTQDFKILINYYKKLFLELEKKYKLSVFFVTYDETKDEYKKMITDNNWNLFTIPEKNSKQFTGTCKFLLQNFNHTLIIRSDLIIKDEFINMVNNIKFDNITVLNKEEKGFYNDTVIFLPKHFISDFLDNVNTKHNRFKFWCHIYKKYLNINLIDNNCKSGPNLYKKYVEIYRGNI